MDLTHCGKAILITQPLKVHQKTVLCNTLQIKSLQCESVNEVCIPLLIFHARIIRNQRVTAERSFHNKKIPGKIGKKNLVIAENIICKALLEKVSYSTCEVASRHQAS